MIYKELISSEINTFYNDIFSLLVHNYKTSFLISESEAEVIVKIKIIELSDYIDKKSASLIVCIDKGNVVALAWIYQYKRFEEKRVHINQISVSQDYQRMGIGRKLMKKIEKKAREIGASSLDLSVSYNNEIAKKMYNEFHFLPERVFMKKKITKDC